MSAKLSSRLHLGGSTAGAKIAPPEVVIAAAEEAPPVFGIAAYYPAVLRLREKGHSWRRIADWLGEFNIEISYVHLRRLFAAESERRLSVSPPPESPDTPGASGADEEKWTRL